MNNPLHEGSDNLLQVLKQEHAKAKAVANKAGAKAGEHRYELMLDTMVQLCEEVQELGVKVKTLEAALRSKRR